MVTFNLLIEWVLDYSLTRWPLTQGEYDMTHFDNYNLNEVRDESMMVYVENLRSKVL